MRILALLPIMRILALLPRLWKGDLALKLFEKCVK
jgi:hypothetical protein